MSLSVYFSPLRIHNPPVFPSTVIPRVAHCTGPKARKARRGGMRGGEWRGGEWRGGERRGGEWRSGERRHRPSAEAWGRLLDPPLLQWICNRTSP
eukprot:gene14768-biopygen190